MQETLSAQAPARELKFYATADALLKKAAALWFMVAVLGQWIFGYYVIAFYGSAAVQGNLAAWNSAMPHGYVAGDALGNFAVAMHLFLAVIILFCGPLQFIPQIRARVPAFHRWTGRMYMLTVVAISFTGLYMILTRGTVGGLPQHIGIGLDAVLIIFFAGMALRYAIARDIATHRRWILRLFMAVSAVWFFRIVLMLWLFVNGGPAGFDPETFRGPFLNFLSFAQYLLPLAILELYLRTQDKAGAGGRFAMAAGLFVLTIATGIGIFVASMGMWGPRLGI